VIKTLLLWGFGLVESVLFRDKRIFVPKSRIRVGGPKSFMRLFCETAREKGVSITHNRFAAARVALIPISMDPTLLARWKKKSPNRKVVQRLDGVFYDPQKSDYDESRNSDLKVVYHQLADTMVFQSNYSRKQCEYFLGKPPAGVQTMTLCNGTDLDLFSPSSQRGNISNRKIRFITTGNFRDTEMLTPILDALDQLQLAFGFELEVVGPVDPSIECDTQKRDYLRLSGICEREAIAVKLRNSDIFLFSFLNPNCPNSVIEATASGLPVVSFESGAMLELCGFNSELLAKYDVIDPIIHRRSELLAAAPKLLEKIYLCVAQYETFRDRAISARAEYDINKVVAGYLDTINSLL